MTKSAVILLAMFVACVLSDDPVVQTKYGNVRGFTKEVDNKQLSVFQGIPYAKPPLSSRRFKPPEEPDKWNDVINTTDPKPACPQNKATITNKLGPNFHINVTDEDCLYLNVYVPETPQNAKKNPLAVMVFIHGGSFQVASGTVWSMSRLAVYANVVVISINYRLGVLGFLSTNDSAARGNWGLLDQLLALKWIKNNIENFGGNKDLITIFGHSAGAYSVSLHVVSPLSQGIFTRAISLAGTVILPVLTTDPMVRVKPLAIKTKCLTKDQVKSGNFQNDKVVECLRKVSASDLLKYDQETSGSFIPVIDQHFIPDVPETTMKAFNYTPVDYIVGGNCAEGTHKANAIPNFYTTAVFDTSEYEKRIEGIAKLAIIRPVPKAALPALMKVMSAKYFPRDVKSIEFKKAFLGAMGDLVISRIFKTGHVYSKKGTIYVYRFTHKMSTSLLPAWVGSGHAEELFFIFGYTLDDGTEDEKTLSRDWMNTMGRFARTGDPRFGDGKLPWTKLTFPSMNYLEITVGMTKDCEKKMWKTDIRRFWNKAIPEVAKLGTFAESHVGVKCYSCTYKFAGTGDTDYKCVNDPANHDKMRQETCTLPKMCGIQATYINKFGKLSSLKRGCLPATHPSLNKITCSKLDGSGGANCNYQCVGQLCNAKAGDLHVNYNPNVAPGLASLPLLLALSLLSIFII